MKSVCDRDRGSREISVGRDDEHVSCIGTAPALVNELKGFVGFVGAVRICTPPTSLFQYQDKLIMILKNRVVDGSCFDSPRVHLKSTGRAKMNLGTCFQSQKFFGSLNRNVGDNNF